MEIIRIGMFSWESLYSIRVGGISPHVSELSEALAAEGHEVHLFTRGFESNDEIINRVYYHRVTCDQSGGIVEQMNRMCDNMYLRFLDVRGKAGEFNILHGHNWHPVNVLCMIKAQFGLIGEGEMRNQCESQAHKLGIGNSCNFLGYAPDNTVIDWFNACDLVCVPSRNDPFFG